MIKLNLKDTNFFPDPYSAREGRSKILAWDRSCAQPGPVIYTDHYLNESLKRVHGRKIAWLLEPIEINKRIYSWIKSNHSMFEEVWTHDDEVLSAIPNGKWVPMAGTWIPEDERRIYEKSKLCSFVASAKNVTTGHRFRQEVRAMLPPGIDKFGKGFHYVKSKTETLKDYCFSIVIENCIRDTYFTEKIIDCFNTGTVPIYWGTWKIDRYFDGKGILQFSSAKELMSIVESLSLEKYLSLQHAVRENFERAKAFETGEDSIIKHIRNSL